ncbi:superoxide dismutase family protein [Ornithinibacillus halotolerans]|uniref:Superoxide dismutase n=1 Tax=Ornithinibacillus halotolerans TaxID=1274357 RepID=A0A916RY40_9BACI|nr:superoxide dismutase family protein [Ornithinibacillus halotolerans]GGA76574.1 superoxide dismutase [Ornithinibacillus halotolerans]
MRPVLLFLLTSFLLVSCQSNAETSATVEMYNTSGDMVGTAELKEGADGVSVKLKLEGLTPGFHGIAVHEYAKCEAPDFKSAGNHLDPEGKEHGLMHPKGPHLGDLPNIEADGSGVVDVELMLPGATLKEGKKSLLRGEGTSLIVSDSQDDGVSQPSGDSGARIICGVIKPEKAGESTETPTDPTEFNEEQEG